MINHAIYDFKILMINNVTSTVNDSSAQELSNMSSLPTSEYFKANS